MYRLGPIDSKHLISYYKGRLADSPCNKTLIPYGIIAHWIETPSLQLFGHLMRWSHPNIFVIILTINYLNYSISN